MTLSCQNGMSWLKFYLFTFVFSDCWYAWLPLVWFDFGGLCWISTFLLVFAWAFLAATVKTLN